MSKSQNFYVELPRIKRKGNSWEGKVIDFLLNHPSNKPATEFAIDAITAFWLAEALEGQLSQPELEKACWSAIERLEAKLATIRRIAGIEKNSMVLSHGATASTTPTSNSQQVNSSSDDDDDDDDEDDDEWSEFELPEELKQANQMLGWQG
ncbi:hypothetical protein [Fischerella sp. PCC 9605]|uniref:hypothetical protein n=1 Tax=Fischerella sp. PCC 9605 TaxID=1173024 RepID=UPI0012DCC35E|nr:hypothetical protein [Fischerella sp. PCC 9605]